MSNKKRRRPGTPSGGQGGSSGQGGSGSGGGSSSPSSGSSSSGTPKREPRIGRRTIPPEGTAAAPPAAKPSSTSSAKQGAPAGNGSSSRPAGLRSAGSGTSRPAQSRPPTGPKKATQQPQRPRGGILAAFRQPSVYPKFGETMAAGARSVLASPVLVVAIMVLVPLMWIGLLLIGLDHVPNYFQNLLALPPLSSFFDLNIVFTVAGSGWGTLILVVGITVVRAAIFAIFTSLIVERLDFGRASMAGVLRGVRCIPPFTGIFFVQITLIYMSQALLQVLGSSIGALLFFAALVGGVHFLAFAPIVVIRDGTTARVGLGTSVRAARLPGSRHVGLVLLYFTVAFLAPSFVPMSSAYTVNPTVSTWAVLLGVSLFHFVIMGALAYRFGVIEDDVPPPAPRRRRSSIFGGGRPR